MKSLSRIFVLAVFIGFSSCYQQQEVTPVIEDQISASEMANDNACWGQATAIFAQMGEMGVHASQQPTPRLGLRNLARALYEAGVIPDDSMESLGVFVANDLGLSINACQ